MASGWTETQAVCNKPQVWVFAGLQQIRARLPFPLLGIDPDNGWDFINHQLVRYALPERLTFTRGRAWKKNNGCFVEQQEKGPGSTYFLIVSTNASSPTHSS